MSNRHDPHPSAQGTEAAAAPRRTRRKSVLDLASDSKEAFQRDLVHLENAFEQAMETMTLHFQPIVWAKTHEVFGYEALLRTNDDVIPNPGEMFDAAERLNRVELLGRIIRAQICQLSSRAPEGGLLFVNMHALDLLDRSLTSRYSPLAKIRERVVLEVTERDSLERLGDVGFRIAELRQMGYKIAIDDLGAGHARMNRFSPSDTDFVKLDMSLVRGLQHHPIKQQLVSSVTALCREHDIRVVGEGVETADEREILVSLGCDLLQGFYIARPAPEFVVPPLLG